MGSRDNRWAEAAGRVGQQKKQEKQGNSAAGGEGIERLVGGARRVGRARGADQIPLNKP